MRSARITISLLLTLFAMAALARPAFAGPFDNCDYAIAIKDSRFGFVWKPTGAHRPQAVLVLPGRFTGFVGSSKTLVVKSVTLYRADTEARIAEMPMKSNGLCPGGGECLNRPTFAHPTLSGAALKRRYGNIRIRVQTNIENHIHCTKAFNPKERQD